MITLFQFLTGAVGPLAIRVLMSLGFASVSFAGVNTAFQALITYAQSSWSSLPAAVLQLASLAGVPVALGMVFGAATARVMIWMSTSATKLIFKGV